MTFSGRALTAAALCIGIWSGWGRSCIAEILIQKPRLPLAEQCGMLFEDEVPPNVEFEALDSEGQSIGKIQGIVDDSGTKLSDSLIFVAPDWRRKGIGRMLMGHLLAEYPDIRVVTSSLVLDSYAAFRKYADTGASNALRITPAYRILSPFGFNQFKFRMVTIDEVLVTFERP